MPGCFSSVPFAEALPLSDNRLSIVEMKGLLVQLTDKFLVDSSIDGVFHRAELNAHRSLMVFGEVHKAGSQNSIFKGPSAHDLI